MQKAMLRAMISIGKEGDQESFISNQPVSECAQIGF